MAAGPVNGIRVPTGRIAVSGETVGDPKDESEVAPARVRRRLTWGGAAWLFVLVATGIVQIIRRQWIDAAFFGAAALLLAADAAGLFPVGRPRPRPRMRVLLGAAAGCLVVLSLAPRHGVLATVTMLAIGVGAVVIAWPPMSEPRPPSPWPRALRRLGIAWAVIWIIGCIWELIEFILGGLGVFGPQERVMFPALSDLIDPIVTPGLGQAVFAAVWLAIGIFLVVRGGRR
jgi:hypothetical protein